MAIALTARRYTQKTLGENWFSLLFSTSCSYSHSFVGTYWRLFMIVVFSSRPHLLFGADIFDRTIHLSGLYI